MLGSPLTPSDRRSLQVVSLVKETGELEISLNSAIVPQPRPDEVVLRVDAAPINPSDLFLLLAGADANELASSGTAERPVLTGRVRSTTGLAGRLGQALPVGNEGAGTIVEAGSSAAAQALLGRVVAAAPGGGMYAEYRVLRADQCLALHAGSRDRKSTRLNSSHVEISYAVFCLKKKKIQISPVLSLSNKYLISPS